MPYLPRRRSWDLGVLMDPVRASEVRCTRAQAAEFEPRLWMDLVAEYDARLLEAELARRAPKLEQPFSEDFGLFLGAWALDEEKHASGLASLYRLVMGVSQADLDERLSSRSGNFRGFDELLDDEFQLSVLFAYDEAMSTRGYSEDIPFYASLGPPAFETLLRHLKNDEAVHYANAVDLLVTRFADRVDEVPTVMAKIVELDLHQESYEGTFVLDHVSSDFTAHQMRQVGASVSAAIVRRMSAA